MKESRSGEKEIVEKSGMSAGAGVESTKNPGGREGLRHRGDVNLAMLVLRD